MAITHWTIIHANVPNPAREAASSGRVNEPTKPTAPRIRLKMLFLMSGKLSGSFGGFRGVLLGGVDEALVVARARVEPPARNCHGDEQQNEVLAADE